MKRIFHLVYVQRLFCDIWVNFVSQLEWKATGFVRPFFPAEDRCFSCGLSSVCLKKIKMVRRGGRLFIRIYYCSKSLQRLSFNTGLCISIHENCSYHDRSDTLSVFFMEYSKQGHSEPIPWWEDRGRYWDSLKTKVCLSILWHFPFRS